MGAFLAGDDLLHPQVSHHLACVDAHGLWCWCCHRCCGNASRVQDGHCLVCLLRNAVGLEIACHLQIPLHAIAKHHDADHCSWHLALVVSFLVGLPSIPHALGDTAG